MKGACTDKKKHLFLSIVSTKTLKHCNAFSCNATNTRSQYILEASINIKSFIRHTNIPHILELWESRNSDTANNLKIFQFIYNIIQYNIIYYNII